MIEQPCFYVLECSDRSLYVGSTTDLEQRLWQHQTAAYPDAYTATRRPVTLLASFPFATYEQARIAEDKMKGWSRKKKLAFIAGNEAEFLFYSRSPKERRRLQRKADRDKPGQS